MNPGRRVGLGLAIVAVLTLAGSAGYMLIERMPFLDALYMTVITITTVGYEEVKPLDTAGRLFTIVIIFVGVGTAYYVFAAITEVVVSGQFREFVGKSTMNRKIQHLEGHVILCGYGRFGRVVADELKTDRHTVVVIEANPALEPELVRSGLFYIVGSRSMRACSKRRVSAARAISWWRRRPIRITFSSASRRAARIPLFASTRAPRPRPVCDT
jgi:voltage-gated potassium channel